MAGGFSGQHLSRHVLGRWLFFFELRFGRVSRLDFFAGTVLSA